MRTRLKSLAIGPLMMTLVGVAAHAGWRSAASAEPLGWLGAAIAAGTVPIYLGWVIVSSGARTDPALRGPMALAAAGAALAIIDTVRVGADMGALAHAGLGLGGAMAYTYWYSRLDRAASAALQVGSKLPVFSLRDAQGREVSSTSFRGAPVVFLFFRGNWCPLCMAQIRELAATYRELSARGAQVALISPQPPEHTQALAAKHDVPFLYFVDEGLRAARTLGIFSANAVPFGIHALGYGHDSVLPTVVITSADGTILFCDQTDNYRVRPEPQTFLDVLDGKAQSYERVHADSPAAHPPTARASHRA